MVQRRVPIERRGTTASLGRHWQRVKGTKQSCGPAAMGRVGRRGTGTVVDAEEIDSFFLSKGTRSSGYAAVGRRLRNRDAKHKLSHGVASILGRAPPLGGSTLSRSRRLQWSQSAQRHCRAGALVLPRRKYVTGPQQSLSLSTHLLLYLK